MVNGYRITPEEARPGAFVLFKGQGFAFRSLSALISIYEPAWRRLKWKPWHTAVIVSRQGFNATILEGYYPVSRVSEINLARSDIRIYAWFEDEPDAAIIQSFVGGHVGAKYDILVYVLTVLSYFLRRLKCDFPRLMDRSLTCWELVWEFADFCGKDISDAYDYPFIVDLLRAVGEIKN